MDPKEACPMRYSIRRSVVATLPIVAGAVVLILGAAGGHESGLSVRFENDQVRVLELRLKPGEREGMHTHPRYVLYALTDYRVRNTSADGTITVFDRKRG